MTRHSGYESSIVGLFAAHFHIPAQAIPKDRGFLAHPVKVEKRL
jgi:hypothetical protein